MLSSCLITFSSIPMLINWTLDSLRYVRSSFLTSYLPFMRFTLLLICVMLCYVMLCYVMLCYVILCVFDIDNIHSYHDMLCSCVIIWYIIILNAFPLQTLFIYLSIIVSYLSNSTYLHIYLTQLIFIHTYPGCVRVGERNAILRNNRNDSKRWGTYVHTIKSIVIISSFFLTKNTVQCTSAVLNI